MYISPSQKVATGRASGEATPHHLVLTDEAVRSLDSNVKMNPPLRSDIDRFAFLLGGNDGEPLFQPGDPGS